MTHWLGAAATRAGFTGGRVPISEAAVFSQQMADEMVNGASTATLQRLSVAGGMRTLRTTAIELTKQGETTLAEVERAIGAGGGQEPRSATVQATPGAPQSIRDADIAKRDGGNGKAGPTVLVVDDDPVQRLFVTTILEKSAFRVAQAHDGAAALQRILSGEEFQLVLTDLDMPEMDGEMLIRRVRANPRTTAMPIIVVTGSAEADRESQLIEIGADDYIRKPVDPPRLLARVRGALRRAS